MYTFDIDSSSYMATQRGVPCLTNNGVSYTKLVSSLVVTLKINYYFYCVKRRSTTQNGRDVVMFVPNKIIKNKNFNYPEKQMSTTKKPNMGDKLKN